MKSALKYIGGKAFLASWIISKLPEHTVYVEPFGGAAHVLNRKEPSPHEIYNDTNEEMVNLFRVLQDPEKTRKLLRLLFLTPYSRRFFYEIRDGVYCPPGPHDVVKAYRTLVLMKQSFNGDFANRKASWSYNKSTNRTRAFCQLPGQLRSIADRFRNVQIESLDFRNCIMRYDTVNTLFYCDPPYIGKEGYYTGNFSNRDHLDLAEILNRIKGKVIISYYDNEFLDRVYPAPLWRKLYRKVPVRSVRILHGSRYPKAEEVLLMNFDDCETKSGKTADV